MRVRLLGTAAGGGVPQWNCNCSICRQARLGTGRVRPRTQSSVAISPEGKRWFLLNASPDLARQIESFPPLQPQPAGPHPRGTPIQGVLLTNADLDHTLGLLSLREGSALSIHASRETKAALTHGLGLLPTLKSFCKTNLFSASTAERQLLQADGSPSALAYRAFKVPCKKPRYASASASTSKIRPAKSDERGAIAYRIRDLETGGRLIYIPEILNVTESLAALMNDCELLLFDGTFWSNDEMAGHGITGPTALKMGHLPIQGEAGSLHRLAQLTGPRKVYVHINNTNPILLEDSPERRQVLAAGWQIGEDGMEFEI